MKKVVTAYPTKGQVATEHGVHYDTVFYYTIIANSQEKI